MKYLFIFLILLNSCTKEFTAYNNEKIADILIIDAYISNVPVFDKKYYDYIGYKYINGKDSFTKMSYLLPSVFEQYDSYVRLKLLNTKFAPNDFFNYLTDAIVVIKDDQGNIDTLRTLNDPKFNQLKYRSPFLFDYKLQNLLPEAGHTYYLEVYYKNKKYTASTTIPKNRPIIDSFVNEHNEINNYKTISYFKDLPNEKNFYFFRNPNNIFIELFEFSGGDTITSSVYGSINPKFNGFFTNVLNDDYLFTNKTNKIYGFLGTWLGINTNDNYEPYSMFYRLYYHSSLISPFNKYGIYYIYPGLYDYYNIFFKNTIYNTLIDYAHFFPFFLYNNIFCNNSIEGRIGLYKDFLFGTIDEKTYIYFDKLKKLYKTDGQAFSPSPVTPTTNITGGAFGFFYGVNAFPYTNYGLDVAYPDGTQISKEKNIFNRFNNKNEVIQSFTTPKFCYPFNTIK